MAINENLTKSLYDKHIKIYKQKEQDFLNKLSDKSKEHVNYLINMTDATKQDEEISNAIIQIENLITPERILESSLSVEQIQQEIAKTIIDLDKELQAFGKEESIAGLKALAEGNYGKAITSARNAVNLVSDSDLNAWITKIMVRINQIKTTGQQKKFTGYLSNLKGAYLEAAVLNSLKEYFPQDLEVKGEVSIGTGNMGSGSRRQIAEDIMLVYGNQAKKSLQKVIDETPPKKRINIPVPIYEDIIQKESVGISVKAGAAPIKFYDGNLNKFFIVDGDDVDVVGYHQNVLNRNETHHTDNEKGRMINRYLVAYHLPDAIGHNNIFLATRDRLLTTMSEKLSELKEEGHQLYMTSYKIGKNGISGRVYEPKY